MFDPSVKVEDRKITKADGNKNKKSSSVTLDDMINMSRTTQSSTNDESKTDKKSTREPVFQSHGAEHKVSIVTPESVLSSSALGISGEIEEGRSGSKKTSDSNAVACLGDKVQ